MICEVLVKIAASGITHSELDYPIWTCRAGHPRTSIIPGAEVSGVIAVLGSGTAGVAVGAEVFGLTDQLRDGTAAEYVAVEARNLAPKPRTVDHVTAGRPQMAGCQKTPMARRLSFLDLAHARLLPSFTMLGF